jgi:hypothetical protein
MYNIVDSRPNFGRVALVPTRTGEARLLLAQERPALVLPHRPISVPALPRSLGHLHLTKTLISARRPIPVCMLLPTLMPHRMSSTSLPFVLCMLLTLPILCRGVYLGILGVPLLFVLRWRPASGSWAWWIGGAEMSFPECWRRGVREWVADWSTSDLRLSRKLMRWVPCIPARTRRLSKIAGVPFTPRGLLRTAVDVSWTGSGRVDNGWQYVGVLARLVSAARQGCQERGGPEDGGEAVAETGL